MHYFNNLYNNGQYSRHGYIRPMVKRCLKKTFFYVASKKGFIRSKQFLGEHQSFKKNPFGSLICKNVLKIM